MADDRPTATTTRLAGDAAKPPARRGRPIGDREAKRAELLKAATSVIAREGYAGASLRKVAQHAECTTGAVTYYFANKEAMIVAVAESLFDLFDTSLVPSRDRVDVRANFEQWLEWMSADNPDPWLALFQLLGPARHDPALGDVFNRRYSQYRDVFAAILARGQREGSIRVDIPADLLADQLSAMGDGWMVAFPIERERFNPSRLQALMDSVVTLISPPQKA